VEEISAAADIAPRTFFNYFPTKDAAFSVEPHQWTTEEIVAELRSRPAAEPPATAMREVVKAMAREADFAHLTEEWELLRELYRRHPDLFSPAAAGPDRRHDRRSGRRDREPDRPAGARRPVPDGAGRRDHNIDHDVLADHLAAHRGLMVTFPCLTGHPNQGRARLTQQFAQDAGESGAVVRGERGEESVGLGAGGRADLGGDLSAVAGRFGERRPAVLRVGAALDQALGGQAVQEFGGGARRDVQVLGQRRRPHRAVVQQYAQGAEPGRREVPPGQCSRRCLAQQPGHRPEGVRQ
jgi:AcrR family transcriptional regulator